mgnify:CR=1 FL=1
MILCYYALGGINYKNGVITTCPRQANQLVFAHETILPSDIYNHKNFIQLRKKMYNDEWPSGCDTCEEMEKNNLSSMRKDYHLDSNNVFHKHNLEGPSEKSHVKLMQCYDTNTHVVKNEGLKHVEFRFSTACNFSCLHCSKVYSSGWDKKLKNYIPDSETKLYDLRQLLGTEHRHGPNDKNEMSLTTKEALLIAEDLNENFPNIEFIDFAGGEVLYQKQFFPTLRKLSEHPNAKNMLISFHTNFNANFDLYELSDVLSKFNKSAIIISVDAGRTFYSYFRHGGTWDKLEQNIKEFKKYNDFTTIDVSCTTSIYQMFDLYDVFDSFFRLDCHFDASIVQTPQYLDPSLIFHEFKEETLKDISKTDELITKNNNKLKSRYWFNYIINYIKNTKINYHHFNRFLIYRKKSDEIWKQNFNDYFQNYQIEDNELIRVK